MPKSLVLVESPTKAKTINKYLGSDFIVEASGGHVMDLPRRKMGVDVEHNFQPEYVVIPARKKLISQIKKEAKTAKKIFLAADPDREGEAICWHLQKNLKTKAKIFRVIFHEITRKAIEDAFAHPGSIDMHKVEAQQARRVLDRLVGYNLSPLLWKKVSRGLSAGRVQSVAVRLIVEREREIGLFIPQEYWEIEAELKKKQSNKSFIAQLDKIADKKAKIENKEQADRILEKLRKEEFKISDIQKKDKRRNPQAPYTTSKLQQEAFNQLRFVANRTMSIAQQLYEGIKLGDEGNVGLITYMRTDSVRVSNDAINASRKYIKENFGQEYLPGSPMQYKAKKAAQQAHEAIRPALPLRSPETIKQYLNKDQYKLYTLIWNKFLASQMKPAIYEVDTILIKAGEYLFKVVGSTIKFDGFLKLWSSFLEEKEEKKQVMPPLEKGEKLDLVNLYPHQHFTQPPPRYTDASLVRTLEEKGIGRPSTYAPTIHTIIFRDYVRRQRGHFFPTELGFTVSDMLTRHFPMVLNVEFTASLEDKLDDVEEGRLDWTKAVKLFYEPFIKEFSAAQDKIKKEVILTREICERCGRPMVIKWGRHGRFLSCSGFPECRNARSITTNVQCPKEGCSGMLIERRTKSGRIFYGCSKYPKCRYLTNKLPEADEEKVDK